MKLKFNWIEEHTEEPTLYNSVAEGKSVLESHLESKRLKGGTIVSYKIVSVEPMRSPEEEIEFLRNKAIKLEAALDIVVDKVHGLERELKSYVDNLPETHDLQSIVDELGEIKGHVNDVCNEVED